jgi:hypothetical protein
MHEKGRNYGHVSRISIKNARIHIKITATGGIE